MSVDLDLAQFHQKGKEERLKFGLQAIIKLPLLPTSPVLLQCPILSTGDSKMSKTLILLIWGR